MSESLRKALLQLYDRHMTPDGRKVDYAGLRADPYWRQFVDATAELQKVRQRGGRVEVGVGFEMGVGARVGGACGGWVGGWVGGPSAT